MAVGENLIKPKGNAKTTKVIVRRNRSQTFRKFFLSTFIVATVASGIFTVNYIANKPKKEPVHKADIRKSDEESKIKRMNGGEYGETPYELRRLNKDLLDAATKSDAEKVAHLLDIGADVNTKTGFNSTPLMLAARNWWISDKTIRVLVENGADVNAKNSLGLTPLMIASMHGNTSAVEFLLEHGADADAVDNIGETALDKAVRFEFEKTTALLENYEKNRKKNFLSF